MVVQKFHFNAVAKDGKNLSGSLFADDIDQARKKLSKAGMAVLDISVYTEETENNKERHFFEFEAINEDEEEKRGEIESRNEYEAYKKLISTYNFKVLYLADKKLPYEEKERLKKEGTKALEKHYEEELKETGKKKKTFTTFSERKYKEKKQEEARYNDLLSERQKEMELFKKEIEFAIYEVQNLLNKHSDFVEEFKKREIQERVDKLSRLRNSNSMKHLRSVMEELFEIIASDDIFVSIEDNLSPEFEVHKKAFKNLSSKLNLRLKKKISTIKIDLEKLEAIKKLATTSQYKLLQGFFSTMFMAVLFFFVFWLAFFWINVFKFITNNDIARVEYYFQSESFWAILSYPTLLYVFWIMKGYFKSKTFKQRVTFYAMSLAFFAIFVIEFPVLFFWAK